MSAGVGNPSFLLDARQVARDILIPRYYDPRISKRLSELEQSHKLVPLKTLVELGHIIHSHGNYVPKIYYGTGPYPYVRTSDLANWEIKASPKHGVPESVYEAYQAEQNVNAEDIFFVHEGTYLIGSVAMITAFDGPMLYQHHLAKFSVQSSSPIGPYFLLCAIESPEIHAQVRARQFSADIIDSVVGRLEEVVIPIPRDPLRVKAVEQEARAAVLGRAELRERLSFVARHVDLWLRQEQSHSLEQILEWMPVIGERRPPALLGGRIGFRAGALAASEIRNDVLLPRYYDEWVVRVAKEYAVRCDLITVAELKERGAVQWQTGDEIGRLNYGSGDIPFVRTSDFGSWELKREAKQGVSQDVYSIWAERQDVAAGDILLVRDGTYLVGTSILVHQLDLPLLYCGGIIKIRAIDKAYLAPALLFVLLNTPFVRRQVRNKQFTRDVIDTIGQRLDEIVLPIPKDAAVRRLISLSVHRMLSVRSQLRHDLHRLTINLFGHSKLPELNIEQAGPVDLCRG
jgi:hypothetical protein